MESAVVSILKPSSLPRCPELAKGQWRSNIIFELLQVFDVGGRMWLLVNGRADDRGFGDHTEAHIADRVDRKG